MKVNFASMKNFETLKIIYSDSCLRKEANLRIDRENISKLAVI